MKKFKLHHLYILFALLFIINSCVKLAFDYITFPKEEKISISAFDLVDIKDMDDGSFISYSADPQIIYNQDISQVRSIYYKLKYGGSGIVCGYYKKGAEDYNNKHRLFPEYGQNQEVFYRVPKGSTEFRLDVGSIPYEFYKFDSIVINKKPSVSSYFSITAKDVMIYLLGTLILYSIFEFLKELYLNYFKS